MRFHTKVLNIVTVKVQNPEDGYTYFFIQRHTPFQGFVLFSNSNDGTSSRCNRNIYKDCSRVINALWIEVGKHLEDCYKNNNCIHEVTVENFDIV